MLFNTASSAAPQIPLCRMILGSNQGLLRRALTARLTTWLDLIRPAGAHMSAIAKTKGMPRSKSDAHEKTLATLLFRDEVPYW